MPEPAWYPDERTIASANLTAAMSARGLATYDAFFSWSVTDRAGFWEALVSRLGVEFDTPAETTLRGDAIHAEWFPGARWNVAAAALRGDRGRPALVASTDHWIDTLTLGELGDAVRRFAAGFAAAGLVPGDRVAIAMLMNPESVIAYLGTIYAGGVVVSIADSFSPTEIAVRLRLTAPALVVTQDRVVRTGKPLPMYEKVVAAGAERCVVVDTGAGIPLRSDDVGWESFLADGEVTPHVGAIDDPINVLFSSGTTGDPKAIPWSHATPLKSAMDGHFHHDIHPGDVVAWPTNLGWMMGPWLIFASLLNGGAMALHHDAPVGRGFTEFVDDAGVSMLGLVPSLVAAWRANGALDGLSLPKLRVISSTGEASSPDDYRWLMETTGVPVIEYCGGTEIGGGYITGTVLHPATPSEFTTPALGLDVRVLDEDGSPASSGELFIVPPSVGLSHTLLNRDHDAVYYADLPECDVPLRRHGDHMERLPSGNYRAHGRIDDTMNLGGIKVSSAELERAVCTVEGVAEAAAIAVTPEGGGPSQLVVYAVAAAGADTANWRLAMQDAIRNELNPLFKLHDVVVVDGLPRTASHKLMRRKLRAEYGR